MKHLNFKLFSALLAASLGFACSQQQFDLASATKDFGQRVKYNRQADVLFVLEASGAMDNQQRYQAISQQAGDLIKVLNNANLDYHIAVTTMTPRFQDPQTQSPVGDGGRFISHGDSSPLVLDSTISDIGSILANRLFLNSNDFISPINFGRLAVMNALSDPLLSKENANFLRKDALLNIIFISSKEDDINNQSNIDLIHFLDQLKPPIATTGQRSWLAHYVGVLSNATTDQCASGQWHYRSAGLKFMEVVTASGGSASTICDSDLTLAVKNVRARILEVVTQYYIDQKPNVSTIKVYEAGVLIAQDATNGWTYDDSIQSLVFHGTAIPADGTPFHVDYTPAGIK